MKKIAEFYRKNPKILTLTGALAGGIVGFLYWRFIGCSSGSCPLTSNPLITTGYGIFLGALSFWK